MKRFLKRLLGPVWRLTLPLRARAVARLDQIVFHATARVVLDRDPVPAILGDAAARYDALAGHIGELARRVDAARARFDEVAARYDEVAARFDEVTLVLDAVMSEQFRLQSQVESLRSRIDDALAPTAADGWGAEG